MKIGNILSHPSKYIYALYTSIFLSLFYFEEMKENSDFDEHSPWPSLLSHCKFISNNETLAEIHPTDSNLYTYPPFSREMISIVSIPLSLYLCGLKVNIIRNVSVLQWLLGELSSLYSLSVSCPVLTDPYTLVLPWSCVMLGCLVFLTVLLHLCWESHVGNSARGLEPGTLSRHVHLFQATI